MGITREKRGRSKTPSGEEIKKIKAIAVEKSKNGKVPYEIAQIPVLKKARRLEELHVYEKVIRRKDHEYIYWYASWRRQPSGKVKDACLGRANGKNAIAQADALQKARRLKDNDYT
jgi:hypothetical protein